MQFPPCKRPERVHENEGKRLKVDKIPTVLFASCRLQRVGFDPHARAA